MSKRIYRMIYAFRKENELEKNGQKHCISYYTIFSYFYWFFNTKLKCLRPQVSALLEKKRRIANRDAIMV